MVGRSSDKVFNNVLEISDWYFFGLVQHSSGYGVPALNLQYDGFRYVHVSSCYAIIIIARVQFPNKF